MTFQDVIMSTTGILLMFTFVLILSVGVNQYQKALEERQLEMEQMEQMDEMGQMLETKVPQVLPTILWETHPPVHHQQTHSPRWRTALVE
jgi:hypothetical protein